MKRLVPILAVICLAVAAVGGPADAKSERIVPIGGSWTLKLDGNPSTGYRWRLDAAASSGLKYVRVETLGYQSSRKKERPVVVGAPAPFLFRITCLKPGTAHLRFAYIGPTGKSSSKKHAVSLHCV